MGLPVHRWFRYSAGFSASWVESIIRAAPGRVVTLDPFAGSATTLLAAEAIGAESWGLEAHPFVYRVARAKLYYRTDPQMYLRKIEALLRAADAAKSELEAYPSLIRKCYSDTALVKLDKLRRGFEQIRDDSPASELAWMTLIAILRKVSGAGTAQWQYVLPKKQKRTTANVTTAFSEYSRIIYHDMLQSASVSGPPANLLLGDARTCAGVPATVNLVITSPPYPNNYDYADATRLEMSFMREIDGWGDLQETVRKYLIRSCSQHVPESAIDLDSVLAAPELSPIRGELQSVCRQLSDIRTDGNIVPPPSLIVSKHVLRGAEMAVVTVEPADSPPVRFKGRVHVRIGPRRGTASLQDERILNEKRRHGDLPFDARPLVRAVLCVRP